MRRRAKHGPIELRTAAGIIIIGCGKNSKYLSQGDKEMKKRKTAAIKDGFALSLNGK